MEFSAANTLQELPQGYISAQFLKDEYESLGRRSAGIKASGADINAELSQILGQQGGFSYVAQQGRPTLMREMLYESRHRSFLQIYKLGPGEQAFFPVDIDVPAMDSGVSGLPGLVEIRQGMAWVQTRIASASPFVRWQTRNQTPANLLKQVQDRLKASLMLQESASWIRLLQIASGRRSGQGQTVSLIKNAASAASQNAPLSVAPTGSLLSLPQISETVAQFGSRMTKAKYIYVNPTRENDIRMFNYGGVGGGGNGFFMPQMQELLIKQGNVGSLPIVGCELISDVAVPHSITLSVDVAGKVGGSENVAGYIIGPSELVGLEILKTDLQIKTQESVMNFGDVYGGWTDYGFFLQWLKSIQRLVVS